MWRTIWETAQAPAMVPRTNTTAAPTATRRPQRRIPAVSSAPMVGARRYRLGAAAAGRCHPWATSREEQVGTGQAGTGQPGYLQEEPTGPPISARVGAVPGMAGLVALLLVTALAGVALHEPAGGGARLGVGRPAPIALASAAAALRFHTVRMHMAGAITVTNQGRAISIDLAGDGDIDYAARSTEMTLATSVAGIGAPVHIAEELRVVGG